MRETVRLHRIFSTSLSVPEPPNVSKVSLSGNCAPGKNAILAILRWRPYGYAPSYFWGTWAEFYILVVLTRTPNVCTDWQGRSTTYLGTCWPIYLPHLLISWAPGHLASLASYLDSVMTKRRTATAGSLSKRQNTSSSISQKSILLMMPMSKLPASPARLDQLTNPALDTDISFCKVLRIEYKKKKKKELGTLIVHWSVWWTNASADC